MSQMQRKSFMKLAIFTIEKSAGAESRNAYSVIQDIKNSEIRANCTMAGSAVRTKAYLSASSNALVLELSSEKGNPCTVQSPFDGVCITVTRADNQQPVSTVQNEEEFTFGTTAGVTCNIKRAECKSAPAGSPVITAHPGNPTVVLPASASFIVSASGKELSYQWQKNRADIPGATSPRYTTPATSLYDIGSAYRCAVSNTSGTTRSNPGILNAAGTSSCQSQERRSVPAGLDAGV